MWGHCMYVTYGVISLVVGAFKTTTHWYHLVGKMGTTTRQRYIDRDCLRHVRFFRLVMNIRDK